MSHFNSGFSKILVGVDGSTIEVCISTVIINAGNRLREFQSYYSTFISLPFGFA
jgi:hypothetical protein